MRDIAISKLQLSSIQLSTAINYASMITEQYAVLQAAQSNYKESAPPHRQTTEFNPKSIWQIPSKLLPQKTENITSDQKLQFSQSNQEKNAQQNTASRTKRLFKRFPHLNEIIDKTSGNNEYIDGLIFQEDTQPIIDLILIIGRNRLENIINELHKDKNIPKGDGWVKSNLSHLLNVATNPNQDNTAMQNFLRSSSDITLHLLLSQSPDKMDQFIYLSKNPSFVDPINGEFHTFYEVLNSNNPGQYKDQMDHILEKNIRNTLLSLLVLKEFELDTHSTHGLELLNLFGIDPKRDQRFLWSRTDLIDRADLYYTIKETKKYLTNLFRQAAPNKELEINLMMDALWVKLKKQDVQDSKLSYTPHGWKHSIKVMKLANAIFLTVPHLINELSQIYGSKIKAQALLNFVAIFHDVGYGCLKPHDPKDKHAKMSGDLLRESFAKHLDEVFGISEFHNFFEEIHLTVERHGADKPSRPDYTPASDKQHPLLLILRLADNLEIIKRLRQLQQHQLMTEALSKMHHIGASPNFLKLSKEEQIKILDAKVRFPYAEIFRKEMPEIEAEQAIDLLNQLNHTTFPHFEGAKWAKGYRITELKDQLVIDITVEGNAKGNKIIEKGAKVEAVLYQVLRAFIAADSLRYKGKRLVFRLITDVKEHISGVEFYAEDPRPITYTPESSLPKMIWPGISFKDLDNKFEEIGTKIQLLAGETLFQFGDKADAMYQIIEGLVEIHIPGETLTAARGALIGEGGIVEANGVRNGTIIALKDTELYRISNEEFESWDNELTKEKLKKLSNARKEKIWPHITINNQEVALEKIDNHYMKLVSHFFKDPILFNNILKNQNIDSSIQDVKIEKIKHGGRGDKKEVICLHLIIDGKPKIIAIRFYKLMLNDSSFERIDMRGKSEISNIEKFNYLTPTTITIPTYISTLGDQTMLPEKIKKLLIKSRVAGFSIGDYQAETTKITNHHAIYIIQLVTKSWLSASKGKKHPIGFGPIIGDLKLSNFIIANNEEQPQLIHIDLDDVINVDFKELWKRLGEFVDAQLTNENYAERKDILRQGIFNGLLEYIRILSENKNNISKQEYQERKEELHRVMRIYDLF
ncbi:hypothetical protein BVY03_02390 [bacterium K02(2017)]|nr:hypothetical protein BVY03_02390 [bacterium K02(2017)]